MSKLSEKITSIPNDEDWGEYWKDGLDTIRAHKVFFSHDLSSMISFFQNSPLSASEYLRYMPARPFQYYAFGFVDLIMSSDTEPDLKCKLIPPYLYLLDFMLLNKTSYLSPVVTDLMSVVDHIERGLLVWFDRTEVQRELNELILKIKENFRSVP